MNKELLEKVINLGLKHGATFSEVFYEKASIKNYVLTDSKLEKIVFSYQEGAGIRLRINDNTRYAYTNELNLENLLNVTKNLIDSNSITNIDEISLEPLKEYKIDRKIEHEDLSDNAKKCFMYNIDKIARSKSNLVSQVKVILYECDQKVTIANSKKRYASDDRILTRVGITVTVKEGDKITSSHELFGISGGYEILDKIDAESITNELVESAISKLNAKSCPSGEMPVVIGPAFGAVIFHEACGHAMESTSVAKNISVLSNKLGTKIGSDKLNIVDDGTLPGEWGTINIDDEGNETRRNILIENGILKGYLVDYFDSIKMNCEPTSSCRRQGYSFIPVSRMNNTYLLPGTDKIEDMISSIDYGIYAKRLTGGSVDPVTGDFNFAIDEAYLIKNGEVTCPVKDVSLIGNTLDILQKVEMVSDNLILGNGWCGASSGSVPVGCGQPTIKVSKILVGGSD